MSTSIAFGHIVGAVVVWMLFRKGTQMLADWASKKKVWSREVSLLLGISVDDLEKAEHQQRVVKFILERYNSELFRNRLSDFCGWIQTGWEWIGSFLEWGVLFWVVWSTIRDDASNSLYAWWIVGISIFFWVASAIFGFACNLLTGRFPGQAMRARKLAEALEESRRFQLSLGQ